MSKHGILSKDNNDDKDKDNIFSKVLSSMKSVFNDPTCLINKDGTPAKATRLLTFTTDKQKQTFTITDIELPKPKTFETQTKNPTIATSPMQSISTAIAAPNFSTSFPPVSSHIQSVDHPRSCVPLTELSTLEIIDNKSHDVLCETVLSLDEFMPKDSSNKGTSGSIPSDSLLEDIDLNITVPSTDSDLINIEDEAEFRLTDLSIIPNTEPVKLNLCDTIEDQEADFSIKRTQSRPSIIESIEILENVDEEGQKTKSIVVENEDAAESLDPNCGKLTTPRKKKDKKAKDREADNETSDSSTTRSERGEMRKSTRSKSKPREGKSEIDDPKPRIVLTFRSEKIGPKMRNMTIVSEEDKGRELISTRRSARVRKSVESFDPVVTPRLHTRRSTGPTLSESNSDEADKTNTDPILKRSTRRRSKEFSDNVLANAIARKEKSYNENPPSQRLSRRIKPTAKVLANRELRLGLETQNNARLGLTLDKSPDQTIQPRRSGRRRRSVELTDFTPISRRSRIKKTATGARRHSRQYSDDDKAVLKEQYLSIDDINNCILGSVDGKSGWPSKSESRHARETSEEREVRRLNKMKRKHLGKLGLKAVSPAESSKQRTISEDNLTDDSTMDSTNTEAIAEHLHAQQIILDSEMERIVAEKAKPEKKLFKDTEVTEPKPEKMQLEEKPVHVDDSQDFNTVADEDTPAKMEVSKRASCSDDEVDKTCSRVTRKRMRSAAASRSYCSSSPAGGEEGTDAEHPTEAASGPTCLCEQPSNFYASQTAYTETLFCRAIDSVNGRRVGCSHEARQRYLRASCRTPYVAACAAHCARMRLHHSCPVCGLFCTEGSFAACASGHLSHAECAAEEGACAHCGAPSEPVSVRMECRERGVFMPKQTVHDPAYMSFASKPLERPPDPRAALRTELVPRAQLERLRVCRNESLCDGANASEAARFLKTTIVKAENDLRSAQDIVDAILITGSVTDCVAAVLVASRCGSALALCLLEYAGGRMNTSDADARTSLHHAMLGLAYAMKGENPLTGFIDEKVKGSNRVDEEEQAVPRNAEDYLQVVQYLVAAGCDVSAKDESGRTALHEAAVAGSVPACGALLESRGAQIDACDRLGDTPLAVAAAHEHYKLVRWLESEGADVNTANVQGHTALHAAARSGCTRTLLALLDADAAVNMRAGDGDTALHIAARQDHYNAVGVLLARGATVETLNEVGETAVECAGENTHPLLKLNAQLRKLTKNKLEQLMSSDISNGRELLPVECVNGLDEEEPPPFSYTTRVLYTHNLSLDSTLATLQGCDCKGGVCDATTCACVALAVRPWYRRGRLASDFPHHDPPVLFECNRSCGCNPRTCTNRIVGRAMSGGAALWVRAQVVRGGAGGGWGLRAAAPAARGAPLALYVGELLPAAKAARRDNHHYMFALNVDQELAQKEHDGEWLTVDGAQWGAAARFANHSCRGSAAALRVLTEHRDLRAPHVVLFAARDLKAGDDITFDYGDKFWSMKGGRMHCECGEPTCRYPGPVSAT